MMMMTALNMNLPGDGKANINIYSTPALRLDAPPS